MKKSILFLIIISLLLGSCRKNRNIDLDALENRIAKVDSLNSELQKHYDFTLKGIYTISEDSILADSLSKLIVIPDTTVFFEYLSYKISELENINYITQQEIYFAQDQLEGLKEDVKKKQISEIQYELEVESQKQMINYLNQLVSDNTKSIENIAAELLISVDTIQ